MSPFRIERRAGHLRSADDVVITDIESTGTNTVQFSTYVQSHDGVVRGSSLLSAIQVGVTICNSSI